MIPHYQVTDHLGSVRVVFTDKTSNGVTARNDYYAYGKRHTNSNLSLGSETTNRYLFNGKEAQTTGELGLLDFDTRMYSPEFIRFRNMDILIEEFPHQSPFVYADNNPVRFIDFMGISAENPDSLGGHVPIPAVVITNEPSEYDPTTYNGGTIDDVIVLGTPIGQQVMEPIEGFGNHLWRFFVGRREYQTDGGTTYWVNKNGYIIGLKPLMGDPPMPSFARGPQLFIKGWGKISRMAFHGAKGAKQQILKAAGKSNFTRFVGQNPDIIVKNGEIVLEGVSNSHKGKLYYTGLKAADFLP